MRLPVLRSRAVAAVAASALLLAACGGDDTPDTEAPDDTAVDDGDEAPDDDAAVDEDPDVEVTEDDTDDQAGDDAGATGDEVDPDEALDIARGFGDDLVASIVTYEMSGVDELGTNVRMLIGQDPPSTVATRIQAPDGEVISIVDTETGETIVCFGEGGAFDCFSDDTMFGDDLLDDLPGQGLDLDDQDTPDRAYRTQILGLTALCLVYDELEDVSDVEVCIAEEQGLLLRYVGTDPEFGSRVSLEAVDIADADPAFFEPPSEPMSFGDLQG